MIKGKKDEKIDLKQYCKIYYQFVKVLLLDAVASLFKKWDLRKLNGNPERGAKKRQEKHF